ncbi:MAG: DNA-3-methyladenine glycosylase I [Longimicrobiales bacterium]
MPTTEEEALPRCKWVERAGSLDVAYHDTEWGVPRTDDPGLFEALTLEGAQAGLSWSTILKKREGYREAFHGFDPCVVSTMTSDTIDSLLTNPEIVRHRGKIESTINNAARVLEVQAELGSFKAYVWRFVDGVPVQNEWASLEDLPASTDVSAQMSRDLKKRGFRFVGPTTCYAFMQAIGLVNDHEVRCFRKGEVRRLGEGMVAP